ncbi:MAG TPA: ATP-grasp domain-containing protein [Geminicoccaceae bacterium]|nr:ATP-grasp domain-containing protein [Geminicoccaceae bacterium]
MNVLLTCAGRRNYLVGYFRAALAGRGLVFAADSSPEAPALQEADRALIIPPAGRSDYAEHLLRLCRDNRIRLLFSLNDLELPVLAPHRELFRRQGTELVVSRPSVIELCFDKWATARFLREQGLRTPRTWLGLDHALAALEHGELACPLVIKPRWGSNSIGIAFVDDPDELVPTYRLMERVVARSILAAPSAARDPDALLLVQERIVGEEHGLDIVNDLRGRYATTFVKRKLAMRAGETDRAVTVADDELERLGATLGRSLGHIGNLDCDVFVTEGAVHVLELNPRFGGGYPFSHAAGADLPAAFLAWAAGEEPDPRWLRVRPGVRAAKCERIVVVGS